MGQSRGRDPEVVRPESVLATDVERIEIHNLNRRLMVRLYTRDFVQEMLRDDDELDEIQFVITPTQLFCR